MYEIVKVIVIDRHKCTPLHPEIDGMIEKWFSTNSNLMSTIVDSNQTNLDELIPYVAYASKLDLSRKYLAYGRYQGEPSSQLIAIKRRDLAS